MNQSQVSNSGPDSRVDSVKNFVFNRVKRLEGSWETPGTRAILAHLRNAVSKGPGDDPAIWAVTMEEAPGNPWGDEATPEEWAIHYALCFFGLHSQSRDPGEVIGSHKFGVAVRKLELASNVDADPEKSPIRKRLNALVTASTDEEIAQHLRVFIRLFRSHKVSLNYSEFAGDLFWIRQGGGAKAVRRNWARQYAQGLRKKEA